MEEQSSCHPNWHDFTKEAETGKCVPQNVLGPNSHPGLFADSPQRRKMSSTTRIERSSVALLRDRSKTLEFKSTELLKNCLHKIHSPSALSSEAPLIE